MLFFLVLSKFRLSSSRLPPRQETPRAGCRVERASGAGGDEFRRYLYSNGGDSLKLKLSFGFGVSGGPRISFDTLLRTRRI
eukprot:6280462-Pyramimonas_sp.AAC.1